MFLFGLAPMGVGCAERNFFPSLEGETGDGGSGTSGPGDGSASADAGDSSAGDSSADGDGGDDDGGSDTGSLEDLCEAYAVGYTLCENGYGQ